MQPNDPKREQSFGNIKATGLRILLLIVRVHTQVTCKPETGNVDFNIRATSSNQAINWRLWNWQTDFNCSSRKRI